MASRLRRKGISPVLATLILIVIAVLAGLAVYAWVSGWMGGWIGAGSKELKVIKIIFKQGSWSKTKVGETKDTGTETYDLWSVGYRYYYMTGTIKVYVYDENDNEYELTRSGDNLMYDGTDVGDIDRDDGTMTIDYTALESATGANFVDGKDVLVTCTWQRIDLLVKNTGGAALSIKRIWVGKSSDCPWDWTWTVKHLTLPYRMDPGSERWIYLTHDYTSGATYFFKLECADGSVFGPFSEEAP